MIFLAFRAVLSEDTTDSNKERAIASLTDDFHFAIEQCESDSFGTYRATQTNSRFAQESLEGCVELLKQAQVSELILSGCKNVNNISCLTDLHGLQLLNVDNCALSTVAGLNKLYALRSLDLSGCNVISDIEPLSGLHALLVLNMRECASLKRLN